MTQIPKFSWVGQFQADRYKQKDDVMRWEDGSEWSECRGFEWVKANDFDRLYKYAINLEKILDDKTTETNKENHENPH